MVSKSSRQVTRSFAITEYSAYLWAKKEPTSGLEPLTCSSYE